MGHHPARRLGAEGAQERATWKSVRGPALVAGALPLRSTSALPRERPTLPLLKGLLCQSPRRQMRPCQKAPAPGPAWSHDSLWRGLLGWAESAEVACRGLAPSYFPSPPLRVTGTVPRWLTKSGCSNTYLLSSPFRELLYIILSRVWGCIVIRVVLKEVLSPALRLQRRLEGARPIELPAKWGACRRGQPRRPICLKGLFTRSCRRPAGVGRSKTPSWCQPLSFGGQRPTGALQAWRAAQWPKHIFPLAQLSDAWLECLKLHRAAELLRATHSSRPHPAQFAQTSGPLSQVARIRQAAATCTSKCPQQLQTVLPQAELCLPTNRRQKASQSLAFQVPLGGQER